MQNNTITILEFGGSGQAAKLVKKQSMNQAKNLERQNYKAFQICSTFEAPLSLPRDWKMNMQQLAPVRSKYKTTKIVDKKKAKTKENQQ